jgi:hypothetical protein
VNYVIHTLNCVIHLQLQALPFQISINYKKVRKAGLIIVLIGLIFTIFTAFTFFTKEKVVDLGSVEITSNKPHHLSWSPLIGIAVMGFGGIIFGLSYKK